jgi:hypothetical protein
MLVALAANGIVGGWGWLGLIPLATGIFRFCPAYPLLGINSCGISGGKNSCCKEVTMIEISCIEHKLNAAYFQ